MDHLARPLYPKTKRRATRSVANVYGVVVIESTPRVIAPTVVDLRLKGHGDLEMVLAIGPVDQLVPHQAADTVAGVPLVFSGLRERDILPVDRELQADVLKVLFKDLGGGRAPAIAEQHPAFLEQGDRVLVAVAGIGCVTVILLCVRLQVVHRTGLDICQHICCGKDRRIPTRLHPCPLRQRGCCSGSGCGFGGGAQGARPLGFPGGRREFGLMPHHLDDPIRLDHSKGPNQQAQDEQHSRNAQPNDQTGLAPGHGLLYGRALNGYQHLRRRLLPGNYSLPGLDRFTRVRAEGGIPRVNP